MLASPLCRLIFLVGLSVSSVAHARDESEVERDASRLLEEIATNPKCGIPSDVLREAKGIMILPHYVKAQLGVGRSKGRGVLLMKDEKGNWEKPIPVHFSGLTVGAEAGRKVTDRVILYRTRKAAENDSKSTIMLGASFEYYRGHAIPQKFYEYPEKDRIVYSRSHGILVGATFLSSSKLVQTPKSQPAKPSSTPNTSAEKPQAAPEVTTVDRSELDSTSLAADQLVRQLTAITTAPVFVAGKPATRDPNVSQTAGTTAPKP